MWGILRWLVELVRKHAKNLQEDTPDEEYCAKFVLLRDPNVAKVRKLSDSSIVSCFCATPTCTNQCCVLEWSLP